MVFADVFWRLDECFLFFFFFSSRRRHTRCGRDWSSDVCSSDLARGCRTVAISAGGELAALAEADETARVAVPDDVAMPRAALGYLLGATLGVLDAIGLLRTAAAVEEAAAVADETAARLDPERPIGQNEAKQVAAWLAGRMAVIWGW